MVLVCHRNTALPEVTESIKYNDVNISPGSWGKHVVLKISLTSVFSCVDRITGLGAQLTTGDTGHLPSGMRACPYATAGNKSSQVTYRRKCLQRPQHAPPPWVFQWHTVAGNFHGGAPSRSCQTPPGGDTGCGGTASISEPHSGNTGIDQSIRFWKCLPYTQSGS